MPRSKDTLPVRSGGAGWKGAVASLALYTLRPLTVLTVPWDSGGGATVEDARLSSF